MAKGKQTCKILKEIRKQIAAENDIELVVSECTYQGDCLGTCPKCEAEVRYLERELEKRQRMGKAAVFAGMSLGTLFAATSCNHPVHEPLAGEVMHTPDSTEMPNDSVPNDSIPSDAYLLEGDVLAPEPDTMKAEKKKVTCKNEEPLAIPGDVVVFEEIEGEMPEIFPEVGEVEGESDVYQIVEQMPEFPDGEKALMQYVADHIKYPEEAKKAGAYGRVFVGFVVEPDGGLSDFKVLRGIGHGCDEEALRVVKSMPKWKPGMQRGKAVRVQYLVPVIFKLETEKTK
ncbi:MAG: energy transducer TonB [Bacteroidales bacterium]|nr:energy transducer TonB [Bacteroidales bacterium]